MKVNAIGEIYNKNIFLMNAKKVDIETVLIMILNLYIRDIINVLYVPFIQITTVAILTWQSTNHFCSHKWQIAKNWICVGQILLVEVTVI
jgi:hypothetical protein